MNMRNFISLVETPLIEVGSLGTGEMTPSIIKQEIQNVKKGPEWFQLGSISVLRKKSKTRILGFPCIDILFKDGRKTIGYAYLFEREFNGADALEINTIGFLPEYVGKGIGKQFYDRLLDFGPIKSGSLHTKGGRQIWEWLVSRPDIDVFCKKHPREEWQPIGDIDPWDKYQIEMVAVKKNPVSLDESWLNPTRITAYHSSPVEDISTFRAFTHFGTELSAKHRLGKRKGVMYRVEISFRKLLRVSDSAASDSASLLNWLIRNREQYPKIDLGMARREGAENALLRAGYDGLVYQNAFEDIGQDSWVTLRPGQAKIKEVIDLDPFRSDPIGRAAYKAISESTLLEKTMSVDIGSTDVRCFVNPSPDQLIAFRFQMRGIVYEHEIIWWKAWDSIHLHVANALGIAGGSSADQDRRQKVFGSYPDGKLMIACHEAQIDHPQIKRYIAAGIAVETFGR
jgi:hypothetical protein